MRSPLRDLAALPGLILWSLLLDRDESRERYLGALLSATRADVERLQAELTRERDPEIEHSLANQLVFASSVAGEHACYADKLGHELDRARVELKRWNGRWELCIRVIKRLRAERDEVRAQNEWLSDKLTEMVDATMTEGWERLADEWGVAAQRAALWNLLKRAVRMYRSEIEHSKLVAELLAQRTRERGTAHAEITRIGAQRATLLVQLGQAREEIEARRAHDEVTTRDLNRALAELEQLREDLAHARNQLAGPLGGDMVTLHVGRDKTVTGKLLVYPNGDRYVDGWLVDVPGRTLVPAPDGGDGRG